MEHFSIKKKSFVLKCSVIPKIFEFFKLDLEKNSQFPIFLERSTYEYKYLDQNGSAAILVNKSSAGVTLDMDLRIPLHT